MKFTIRPYISVIITFLLFFSIFSFLLFQHIYPKGHICLAALYNRRPDLPPDSPAWETQPKLTWAFHNLLLMFTKVTEARNPSDYRRYQGLDRKDPRLEHWHYSSM